MLEPQTSSVKDLCRDSNLVGYKRRRWQKQLKSLYKLFEELVHKMCPNHCVTKNSLFPGLPSDQPSDQPWAQSHPHPQREEGGNPWGTHAVLWPPQHAQQQQQQMPPGSNSYSCTYPPSNMQHGTLLHEGPPQHGLVPQQQQQQHCLSSSNPYTVHPNQPSQRAAAAAAATAAAGSGSSPHRPSRAAGVGSSSEHQHAHRALNAPSHRYVCVFHGGRCGGACGHECCASLRCRFSEHVKFCEGSEALVA
jgi:hypothetical protein